MFDDVKLACLQAPVVTLLRQGVVFMRHSVKMAENNEQHRP